MIRRVEPAAFADSAFILTAAVETKRGEPPPRSYSGGSDAMSSIA